MKTKITKQQFNEVMHMSTTSNLLNRSLNDLNAFISLLQRVNDTEFLFNVYTALESLLDTLQSDYLKDLSNSDNDEN